VNTDKTRSTVDVLLFLEGGHASTAVGPLEVFRDAGVLWNELAGSRTRRASACARRRSPARPVCPNAPFSIVPDASLEQIADSDLVYVSSGGLPISEVIARNAPIGRLPARDPRARRTGRGRVLGRVAARRGGLARRPCGDDALGARRRVPRALPERALAARRSRHGRGRCLLQRLACTRRSISRSISSTGSQVATPRAIARRRSCSTCRASVQAGFAVLPVGARHDDEPVRRAERWIQGHCREDVRFDALARELGMSPRNFMRRFKDATGTTPLDYLQRLRVRAAQRMLEDDHRGVSEVGAPSATRTRRSSARCSSATRAVARGLSAAVRRARG
jgi:AraC-like DNA-binding protein